MTFLPFFNWLVFTSLLDKPRLLIKSHIVVGDIVKLSTGDLIPADGILIEGNLSLDESSFTGEAKDVSKKTLDTVYRGSVVLNGGAYIEITAVGEDN